MIVFLECAPGREVDAVDGREICAMSTPPDVPDWRTATPPELPSDGDPPDLGSAKSPSIDPIPLSKPVKKTPLPPAMPDESVSLMSVDLLLEHPDADCIPPMSPDEYEALREDIRRNNVREPVTVVGQGEALDGRHRIRAAKELGIDEIPCRLIKLPDGVSAREWMLTSAVQRRHLTAGQRAALALELDAYREARNAAAARQRATQVRGTASSATVTAPVAAVSRPAAEKSRDVAARLAGASSRTIQDVLKVQGEAPDLYAKVRAGELTPNAAIAQLKRRVGTTPPNGETTGADANKKSSSGKVVVSPPRSKDAQEPTALRPADAIAHLRKVVTATKKILKSSPDAVGTASDAIGLVRVLENVRTDVDELVDLMKARGHGRRGAGGKKTKVTRKGRAGR